MRNDAPVTLGPLDALISEQIDVAARRPRQPHCGGAGYGSQPLGAAPSEGTSPGRQADVTVLGRRIGVRDTRPRDAIDVGGAWVSGEVRIGDARRAALAANAAARGLLDPAKFAALAAGQAAAVAHVAAHDLGAAIRAVGAPASAGETEAARIREREWQRERLPAEVREPVLDDQRSRTPICWNVFDD
ncbi:MAG: hypothetical protein K0R13_3097 [Propionibacteriaceae bacterium]|nr:hypothetical protein [Propionibacteriaceae bacterium]